MAGPPVSPKVHKVSSLANTVPNIILSSVKRSLNCSWCRDRITICSVEDFLSRGRPQSLHIDNELPSKIDQILLPSKSARVILMKLRAYRIFMIMYVWMVSGHSQVEKQISASLCSKDLLQEWPARHALDVTDDRVWSSQDLSKGITVTDNAQVNDLQVLELSQTLHLY